MLPIDKTSAEQVAEFVDELKKSLVEYELALINKEKYDLRSLLKKIEQQMVFLQHHDVANKTAFLHALEQSHKFIELSIPQIRFRK